MSYPQDDIGTVCDCGRHKTLGVYPNGIALTPGDTAARYKRMLEKTPTYLRPDCREYLRTWEAEHGQVRYEMVPVGTNSGSINPASKGQTVYAPRIIGVQMPYPPGSPGGGRRGFDWHTS